MFTINDIDLYKEYGFKVARKGFTGWADVPKRKGTSYHNYKGQSGIVPMNKSSEVVWESRTLKLKLELVCDVSEIDEKLYKFSNFMMEKGVKSLKSHAYMSDPIDCLFYEGSTFDRHTKAVGQVWGTMEISFLEIDPLFKSYIEIKYESGLFDLSYDSDKVVKWVFPDGTESTLGRPTRELNSGGVVKLYANDWGGDLNNSGNGASLIGKLSDFNKLTYSLNLPHSYSLTGDVSDVPNLTKLLSLTNCSNITGDLSNVPNVEYYLSLQGCVNITGDISNLSFVKNIVSVGGCVNVYGIYTPPSWTLEYVDLIGTGMTGSDTAQTLANMADVFTRVKDRTIRLVNNVDQSDPTIQGYIAQLENVGCTITFY